jgi:hypothetical protein
MTINANSIRAILNTNDRAVERAIIILVSRQTADEVGQGRTTESNGRGFSAFNAETGTYLAKWILNLNSNASSETIGRAAIHFLASNVHGRALTGKFLTMGRKIALCHHKQLLEVALLKQAAIAANKRQAEIQAADLAYRTIAAMS